MLEPTIYKNISDIMTIGLESKDSVNTLITEIQTLTTSSRLAVEKLSRSRTLSLSDIESSFILEETKTASEDQLNLIFLAVLQQHIERYAGSVNSYLASNSIKVKKTFADASNEIGYSIDASHIE